jgi:hypothetical protein
MNRYFKSVLIATLFVLVVLVAAFKLSAQVNPPEPPTPPAPFQAPTPFGTAVGPQTPFGPAATVPQPSPVPAPASPFQVPTPFGPTPGPQTPFGQAPNIPQPPATPGTPQSAPDDLSELQRCYKALNDPATCRELVAEQAKWDVRFFEVKYADLYAIAQALSIFRASVNVSSNLRVLSVKAPKEIMPAIEDAIKRLDVQAPPKKNVELTLYVLSASDLNAAGPPQLTMPQSLQPVVNQLKNVFSYKQIQLVDTFVLSGTDGQMVVNNGTLSRGVFGNPNGQFYSFEARLSVNEADQKNPILRLGNFKLTISNSTIMTVLDVPFGQQVVVGKSTIGDYALIVVLNAKFL